MLNESDIIISNAPHVVQVPIPEHDDSISDER